MKNIVIIGGGISGLTTSYNLSKLLHDGACALKASEVSITLVDAKDKPGGNIITEIKDGFLIEGGPDCFLSEKPWAMALCKEVGLSESLLPTSKPRGKTFVLSRGKLHLLPEGVILMVPTKMLPMITSTLISFTGKIRMGLELFVPKKKDNKDESLGEFVRRRLGQEALDKIAEPLVAGVHAGDPDTMSVRSSFPKFVELEEKHGSLIRGMLARMKQVRSLMKKRPKSARPVTMFMTLKGGLTELVVTLLSKIKGQVDVKSGVKVDSLTKGEGKGYSLKLSNGEEIKADVVVISTPAYVAADLLKDTAPAVTDGLKTIPYVSTATVSIAFKKSEVQHPMNGFGFVVPKIEKRRIMAASWSSVKWAGRAPDDTALIRCFIGGAKNAELVFEDDASIEKIVRDELRDIMGIDAEPVICRIFRWKDAMPQYTIGHQERIADIMEKTSENPGLFLTGSAYFGIGISDTVREGEATAKRALEYLSKE